MEVWCSPSQKMWMLKQSILIPRKTPFSNFKENRMTKGPWKSWLKIFIYYWESQVTNRFENIFLLDDIYQLKGSIDPTEKKIQTGFFFTVEQ